MKVKDKVIKMYKNYMQSYFTHWKDNLRNKAKGKKKMMM
jgi:hypothetical protein